jgi:predicted mannosyl-3-phosphoglycerate phosphatase (HAD superfamily)
MNDIRVKGHSDLIKRNGAVISTNKKIYEAAKKRKAEKDRIDNLEAKINNIESLLQQLVEKNG